MLDLAFLILGIYVYIQASKYGLYKETVCNIAVVCGILAAIIGSLVALSKGDTIFGVANLLVAIFALLLPFGAKYLVKQYHEKEVELYEKYERERIARMRNPEEEMKHVYDDFNFDDEELRFGKGGYTDPKL